jgi:hypothetical protein
LFASYLKANLACVSKGVRLHEACETEGGTNYLEKHDFNDVNAALYRPLFQNIPEILPTHCNTE